MSEPGGGESEQEGSTPTTASKDALRGLRNTLIATGGSLAGVATLLNQQGDGRWGWAAGVAGLAALGSVAAHRGQKSVENDNNPS